MQGYFSFDRFITNSFVKVLYFLGFAALTVGGIGLAAWAGMRLQNASIPRQVGWRYVAIGITCVIVGNLVWRVFCEIWVVLFNINAGLVAIYRAMDTNRGRTLTASPVEETESAIGNAPPDVVPEPAVLRKEVYESRRQNSVLGLT